MQTLKWYLSGFLVLLLSHSVGAQDLPNILFIAVDDLRPSIGCYGDALAITPNLDRLAEKSLVFDRAYCQVAVCNPSRASLMTGQRPDKLGVWTLPIHFREAQPDAVTLPQWFRKFGYTAVSHGKIYHNPTPDPQSWSEPIQKLPPLPFPYPQGTRDVIKTAQAALPKNDWRKNNLRAPSTAAPDLPDNRLLDGARTDMAIQDLQRLSQQDKPFFLAMGYIRPHLAWVAPKKYWDLHDPTKLPVLTDQGVNQDTPKYALHNNSEFSHYVDLINMPKPWDDQTLSESKMRQLVHGYYACVSYVDAQIGRLLDALDASGVADNTIVVLWSDHGYKLGEYRGWGKMTNYEIDTRVPLLISAPGMKRGTMPTAGKKTTQLVELLDLFPTLCELAGIDTPSFVDGTSLVPVLKDPATSVHDAAISQYYRRLNGKEYMGYSIRTATHRMVEWRQFSTGKMVSRELYDQAKDPLEQHNLAGTASEALIQSLSDQLKRTHPKRGLVMKPKIHSKPTKELTQLQLENQTPSTLIVVPISSTGARVRKGIRRVAAEKSVSLKAPIGTVYVIESEDGKVQQVHTVTKSQAKLIIERGDASQVDGDADGA